MTKDGAVGGESMPGRVLRREGFALFGARSGGECGIGAIGGDLCGGGHKTIPSDNGCTTAGVLQGGQIIDFIDTLRREPPIRLGAKRGMKQR